MPPLHNPEYIYLPRPPDNDPIIPYNALLHFFEHPSHAGSKSFHRERMVKHINELTLGPDRGLKVGWGIRFKEKLCWRKVFLLEAVISVAGVGVGLLWYLCRADVQGATGITAVILWIGTVVLANMTRVNEIGRESFGYRPNVIRSSGR